MTNRPDYDGLIERLRVQAECGMFDLPENHSFVGFTEAADALIQSRKDAERLGWQPIETAPKDGTTFQGWIGQWEPQCRFNPRTEAAEIWCRVDYDDWDWDTYPKLHLTHWMPKPDPPATLSSVQGIGKQERFWRYALRSQLKELR